MQYELIVYCKLALCTCTSCTCTVTRVENWAEGSGWVQIFTTMQFLMESMYMNIIVIIIIIKMVRKALKITGSRVLNL